MFPPPFVWSCPHPFDRKRRRVALSLRDLTFYGISVLIEKYAAAVRTFYGILVLIEKYAHVSKNVHTFPNSTTVRSLLHSLHNSVQFNRKSTFSTWEKYALKCILCCKTRVQVHTFQ